MSAAPAGLGRHPARSARSAALRLSWVCRRTRQHGRDRHALAAASVWHALDPRRGAVPLDLVLVMLPASCPALARPDWPRLSRGAERQRMCLDEADPDDPPPSPCLLVSEPCLLVSGPDGGPTGCSGYPVATGEHTNRVRLIPPSLSDDLPDARIAAQRA